MAQGRVTIRIIVSKIDDREKNKNREKPRHVLFVFANFIYYTHRILTWYTKAKSLTYRKGSSMSKGAREGN